MVGGLYAVKTVRGIVVAAVAVPELVVRRYFGVLQPLGTVRYECFLGSQALLLTMVDAGLLDLVTQRGIVDVQDAGGLGHRLTTAEHQLHWPVVLSDVFAVRAATRYWAQYEWWHRYEPPRITLCVPEEGLRGLRRVRS